MHEHTGPEIRIPDTPAQVRGGGTAVVRRSRPLLELAPERLERWARIACGALRDDLRDGPYPPVGAMIVRTGGRIRFRQQGVCEQLGWFVSRMNEQLAGLAEPWLAAVVPGAATQRRRLRTYSPANHPLPDAHYRTLRCYVEARTPAVAAVLAGTVALDSSGALAEPVSALPSKQPVLGRLLWGHPARRRHRLG